jgi:hypothetical protein
MHLDPGLLILESAVPAARDYNAIAPSVVHNAIAAVSEGWAVCPRLPSSPEGVLALEVHAPKVGTQGGERGGGPAQFTNERLTEGALSRACPTSSVRCAYSPRPSRLATFLSPASRLLGLFLRGSPLLARSAAATSGDTRRRSEADGERIEIDGERSSDKLPTQHHTRAQDDIAAHSAAKQGVALPRASFGLFWCLVAPPPVSRAALPFPSGHVLLCCPSCHIHPSPCSYPFLCARQASFRAWRRLEKAPPCPRHPDLGRLSNDPPCSLRWP